MKVIIDRAHDVTFGEAKPVVMEFADSTDCPQANEARAKWAFDAVEDFALSQYGGQYRTEPLEQGIRDLVTNMCHLAKAFGYEPKKLLDMAHGMYEAEQEDPEGA